jgi:hypothetical protein
MRADDGGNTPADRGREVVAMTIHDVPASEWPSFLEQFSREHRAWLATVYGLEQGTPVRLVQSVAIRSVTLEGGVSDRLLRLTFADGVSLCVPHPCAVRVQRASDGAERALEVETADGALVRVAFRAVVPPEQLDGVAPGEVAAEVAAFR